MDENIILNFHAAACACENIDSYDALNVPKSNHGIYLSLAMLEFLDIDLGDISKSESDR
jgi:hypothetical protein